MTSQEYTERVEKLNSLYKCELLSPEEYKKELDDLLHELNASSTIINSPLNTSDIPLSLTDTRREPAPFKKVSIYAAPVKQQNVITKTYSPNSGSAYTKYMIPFLVIIVLGVAAILFVTISRNNDSETGWVNYEKQETVQNSQTLNSAPQVQENYGPVTPDKIITTKKQVSKDNIKHSGGKGTLDSTLKLDVIEKAPLSESDQANISYLNTLFRGWFSANVGKSQKLIDYYASNVKYYTWQNAGIKDIMLDKNNFFSKWEKINMSFANLKVTKQGNDKYVFRYDKIFTLENPDGKTSKGKIRSHVVFQNTGTNWLIVNESDDYVY
jgi:hypothetical protein